MNTVTPSLVGQAQPVVDGFCPGARASARGAARREELVRQSGSEGWDQAWWDFTLEMRPEERAAVEQAVGVESGEGWQYLVSLPPEAVALECGCGVGPLNLSLADKVAELYSIDPDPERLQLLHARAEERGLHNLHCVQAGHVLPLPFPDHCFDLVNLNGTLERVPCLIRGNPRGAQRRFLQEIRRILKPAGQVFAGIDNRFALKYFSGQAQEGLGLSYVMLWPRLLAHLVCRLRRGTGYRNYTYSAAGVRRLFRQAGFDNVRTLVLSPHYTSFGRAMATDDAAQIGSLFTSRRGWKALLKRLLAGSGMLSGFAPSFGVVASAGPDGGPRQCRTGTSASLEDLVRRVSGNQQAHYEIEKISVRERGGCVVVLHDRNEPGRDAILKLALNDGRDKLLNRAGRNAALMAGTLAGRSGFVPRTLGHGAMPGHSYVLEERLSGCDGFQLLERGWPLSRLAETVWDFLEEWMRATRRTVRMTQEDFHRWAPSQPEQWRRLVGSRAAQVLGELTPRLCAYMVGRERTVVASHGDLWLGNVLFDEETGDMRGLLDWDSADLRGLPLVDALSLSQSPGIAPRKGAASFDAGFSDQFAESHTVDSLAETLRRVSACTHHPRLARIRSEYGYETDQDGGMALLLIFLKRHQPGHLVARGQTRKWVEAFGLLLADR